MNGNNRLNIENLLRTLVRPDVEIGVALKRNCVEVANRVLDFFASSSVLSPPALSPGAESGFICCA
jgi:hypothetical protein